MTPSHDTKDQQGAGLLGFAVMGCFVTGICGLVHAFEHEDGLGIIAAAASFAAVAFLPFKR